MILPHAASAILYSIQVGAPKSYGFEDAVNPHDKQWMTGFFKTPLEGPCLSAQQIWPVTAKPTPRITAASIKLNWRIARIIILDGGTNYACLICLAARSAKISPSRACVKNRCVSATSCASAR
jgi:hypothetical protein